MANPDFGVHVLLTKSRRMKQIYLLFTLAACLSIKQSVAQHKAPVKSVVAPSAKSLPPFLNTIDIENAGNAATFSYETSAIMRKSGVVNTSLTGEGAAAKFDSVVAAGKPNEESIYSPVYGLYVANKSPLSTYLKGALTMGSIPAIYFLHRQNVPVYFSNKANMLHLSVAGLIYFKVFNLLQTTSRQRAAKVVTTMILPGIEKVGPLLKISGLKSLSFSVMYNCKEFGRESAMGEYAIDPVEIITMSAPVALYRQYMSGGMSEDAFVKQAEFYIKEYDKDEGVKRVELKVE